MMYNYRSRATFVTFVTFVTFFLAAVVFAAEKTSEESDQQINDFSLGGYGDKGKKTWDLSGKSADIFEEVIKLKDITGNLYGAKEDVKLTADRGDFDKSNGKIHIEKNVVITTSSGARLTTDSLDWDRVKGLITTKDRINIKKENMITTATGAFGQPNLNQMDLEKDVTVKIYPQAKDGVVKEIDPFDKDRVVITCDGPLKIDYLKNVAVFHENVKVDREDSQIYSDTMDVYFGANKNKEEKPAQAAMLMGSSIDKIIARGNVKTIRGENVTYSQEAIYSGADKKLTLSGRPRLIIYSTEDFKNLTAQ